MAAQLWIFCYDISASRDRTKVAGLLEERAVRVQESVFEMRGTETEARELFETVKQHVAADDSLRLYGVSTDNIDVCRVWGAGPDVEASEFWIV